MATKNQAADWLEWADKQRTENGGNSRPSNWDKARAPFIISKYGTWQEVYDAAYNQFINSGGTAEEATEYTPNATKRKAAQEKKAGVEAKKAAEELDPYGAGGIEKYQLEVDVDENGTQTVKGFDPDKQAILPMYMYASKSAAYQTAPHPGTPSQSLGGDTVVSITTDYNAIRKKILIDAQASPGGLDGLLDKLYNSGVISKDTYKAKNISAPDFDKGLQYLVNQYSIKAINDYSISGKKEAFTFDDFLKNDFKGSGGTSKTTYDMVITTRQDAADEANQFFMQYLGRSATKAEHDDYYKALNSAEKNAVRYTTTTEDGRVVKGELLTETDRNLIMGKIAGNAIKGSDIDTLMKAGGGAAQDVDLILSHARNYGVKLSRDQATKYVADNLRKGTNTDATKAKIIEIARANYKGFADKISDNVSVKELASSYIYQKAETLEMNPDAVDLFDADIQDAINGNVTMTDFNVRLRQNPSWAKTKNAKEEAAKYATSILESFGLMA